MSNARKQINSGQPRLAYIENALPEKHSGKSFKSLRNQLTIAVFGLAFIVLAIALLAAVAPHWPEHFGFVQLGLTTLLMLGLALAVMIVVKVRRDLLEPLMRLRNWSLDMRRGNLSTRITAPPPGEFGDLARDLNRLSDDLSAMTVDMDAHVHAQTVRLARKTQSLDILYDVASSLSQPGDLGKLLESFLDTFIELVDARAATVRMIVGNNQTQLVASRGLDPSVVEKDKLMDTSLCQCGWAATEGGLRVQQGTLPCAKLLGVPMLKRDCQEFVVVPVTYQDRIIGVYNLFLDRPMSALGEDIQDLLNSVGKHLGLALEKSKLDSDARRLAIMEERNTIGNELHDSLAQALVGMRLQIKMLGESLHKKDLRVAQHEVRSLRTAIDEAHASLRDLLANFRLKIDERGLVAAVTGMAERFTQETGIDVFFHNECRELNLTPIQESQVFHIVKEALTNIRKHSHACNARILLNNDNHGAYTLLIEDDGEGIAPGTESRPGEHIGLSVMRERAERLPGELTIESEPGEGTRIVLSFPLAPHQTAATK